jgi:UDP-N-acetyl-D-glucosamine dehydrogenase
MRGARILILGVAYKKDVDDTRESPAVKLMAMLRDAGAKVNYHDPLVPRFRVPHSGNKLEKSVPLSTRTLASAALVLLTTDHQCVDYELVKRHARLIVDTRRVWKPDHKQIFGA